jgi:hypothetical protein
VLLAKKEIANWWAHWRFWFRKFRKQRRRLNHWHLSVW